MSYTEAELRRAYAKEALQEAVGDRAECMIRIQDQYNDTRKVGVYVEFYLLSNFGDHKGSYTTRKIVGNNYGPTKGDISPIYDYDVIESSLLQNSTIAKVLRDGFKRRDKFCIEKTFADEQKALEYLSSLSSERQR